MNLHRLEITGIGPFPETETVDFDSLSETGVYLLTGRTGSGKTTVLDAVSYAIFGKVPRQTDGDDVVSHHRRLETTPKVVLEATIGRERVRVTRSPKHERPAKKGSGTATEGQSLLVERHTNGEWSAVTGRWTEGDEWLRERIGMTAPQFNQVVMLPQGEFSKFLDSSANDRRALLQRLFPDTDLEWLESWLKKEAERARGLRDEKLQEIADRFQRVRPIARELAADDVEDPLPDPADPDPAILWIDETRKRLTTIATEREQARLAAHDAWEAAATELQGRRDRARLIGKRKAADTKLAELNRRSAWRDETGKKVEAARNAAPVKALAATAAARSRRKAEAAAELDRVKPIVGAGRLTADIPEAEYEEFRQKFRDEAARISEFIANELPKRARLDASIETLEGELATLASTGPESEIGRAGQLVEAKARQAVEAGRECVRVRDARTRGMALALAADLEEGDPCPVCGSLEHPAPPEGSVEVPSEEDERIAEAARAEAVRAEADARRQLAETESRIESARATVRAKLAAAGKELATLNARAAELAGDATEVEDRRDEVETAAGHLDRFLKVAELFRSAESDARTAAREVAEEATARGFDSVELALAAALDPAALKDLERQLSGFDRELSIVENDLAGELAAVDPEETVDLTGAETLEKETSEIRDALTATASQAAKELRTFRTETDQIPALYRELIPLAEAARRAGGLERVTTGRNDRQMRLSIFVLATRLRQVIDAANTHLATMTDQRYTLVYSSDLAGHGAASGLGIDVLDSYTSEVRPTGTLSGGEKFCAALSLALGLAEVVQVEASGKSLDTLFIDEGFGTLDAKSLDQVMTVIDSLREGGRSVGLVSHVEEMRDRITAQIRVTGGRDGSTLRVTTG